MASMLNAADPRASVQLVRGFHAVEQNAWRWTSRSFAVKLRPPTGAGEKGAVLVVKFAVPGIEIEKLKSLTLTASIGSTKLEPETYTRAGDQTYTRDVPAGALRGSAVTVDFELDKAMPPTAQDSRELGIILSTVGFEAKP
jgi:hypothetical protein